ncbi:hypothetical protein [Devosia sediminis]|uniref:Prolamin-like domain-containing protein n=1 Tax=Devosia sediminis TaxID=2798801 RepID=A0A934MK58_9HYPH|nr:hypothetical protein [Devosia sediminis]MBJ3783795.1 hypothetical protein [Devosia sediminis]
MATILALAAFILPVSAADLAGTYVPAKKVAAGQCQSFFGKTITDDLLPAMHDAACCDVLVRMEETHAVNALERRLYCPAWHHYKEVYDEFPDALSDLENLDVPPEVVAAIIPPAQPVIPPPVVVRPVIPPPQQVVPQQPAVPQVVVPPRVSIPWTAMTRYAFQPETPEHPRGFDPGPLNFD